MSDMATLDKNLAAMIRSHNGEAKKLSAQVSMAIENANRNAAAVRSFKIDTTSIDRAVAAAKAANPIK